MSRPRLDERTREALARAIHDYYVARAIADQGPSMDSESRISYDLLSEELRESNRSQAEDIAAKLDMVGATIVSLGDAGPEQFRFTPTELERLSRHEHERWVREKREAGWEFGPALDPDSRTHPCLVEYEGLPEDEKDKDRRAVERIPLLLDGIGLGISRRKG